MIQRIYLSNMKHSLQWTSHLPKKMDKENFKNHLSSCSLVMERLKDILDHDLVTNILESSSKTTFETPNWSEYQAYLMGKQAYINQLKALLPTYKD